MRLFLLLVICLALLGAAGCSSIGYVSEKVVSGVDDYCTKVEASDRAAMRAAVNEKLRAKGHAILVTCKGD